MWILIVAAAVFGGYIIVMFVRSQTAFSDKNAVAANTSGIAEFLHGYNALCASHKILSSGVVLTWKTDNNGDTTITAWLKIYKMDGMDAAESVDDLRSAISRSQQAAPGIAADPMEQYQRKSDMILAYFGTDHLQGNFWDIDDCEYADGKYLEFEAHSTVFKQLKQSLKKTLDLICADAAEKYTHAQIKRQEKGLIIIYIS